MRDIFLLIDAICEAYDNPEWRPHDGATFCNFSVNHVAQRMGYDGFDAGSGPLLANGMVDLMKLKTADWMPIDPTTAQGYANSGSLVVAGFKDKPHGHVCIVRPGLMQTSAKWKMNVPRVLNMGKDVFIAKSMAWAFKDKPGVWVWTGSL